MAPPSAILQGAAALRLDVYDGDVACAGNQLSHDAGTPAHSETAQPGQPFKLDLPSGHHVLLLSAFSDAAATALLGSACAEVDLADGRAGCFQLTLTEPPDASGCSVQPDNCPANSYCGPDGNCAVGCKVSSDCVGASEDGGAAETLCDLTRHRCVECVGASDCTGGKRCSPSGSCVEGCDTTQGIGCPGAIACCGNLCVDTQKDVFNCNGCGAACGNGATDCCGGKCTNPQGDFGNCGACGRACSSAQVATPACGGGLCTSTCTTGFGNCTQPAAPVADDGCETNLNSAPASCGACDRACATTQVATAACAGGVCTSSCNPGFGNCTKPAAPASDDGCETNFYDVQHCGGCTNVCNLANATAKCPSGTCQVDTCKPSFLNCDNNPANGCECGGSACCGTACQTNHSNGLGQTFADCAALNTFNKAQAQEAATAWAATATPLDLATCPGTNSTTSAWCWQTATKCACWGYAGLGKGKVFQNTTNGCICPTDVNTPWN